MIKEFELAVSPETEHNEVLFKQEVLSHLKLSDEENIYIRRLRRSIDARSRQIKYNILVQVFIGETPSELITYKKDYPNVASAPQVIVIGSGPAGLFGALRLVELGYKPIIV